MMSNAITDRVVALTIKKAAERVGLRPLILPATRCAPAMRPPPAAMAPASARSCARPATDPLAMVEKLNLYR
jgi:hypothetical protein